MTNFKNESWFIHKKIDLKTIIINKSEINVKIIHFNFCIFSDKRVDFSPFKNCIKLSIIGGNIEEIIGWPPNIKEINLGLCKSLKNIPVNLDQYKFLERFNSTNNALINLKINLDFLKKIPYVFITDSYRNKKIDKSDFSKIKNKSLITQIIFRNCKFETDIVNFSNFVNLKNIEISNSEIFKISNWPKNLEKLFLNNCFKLRSIPTSASQYQNLRELKLQNIFLSNWDIDLSKSYFLSDISLENLKTHKPKALKDETCKNNHSFKIPYNWAYCIGLVNLNIEFMQDLQEIPIFFSHNPRINITISDCPKIRHIKILPTAFHDCTEVSYTTNSGKVYKTGKCVDFEIRKMNKERIEFINFVNSKLHEIENEKLKMTTFKWIYQIKPMIKTISGRKIFL